LRKTQYSTLALDNGVKNLIGAASAQWHCSKSRSSPTRIMFIYWALSL